MSGRTTLGDLTRPEYIARRDAINTELAQLSPGPLPDLDQARKVLEDFSIFWTQETDPAAKRQPLALIFERVWLDDQRLVAVQPKSPFAHISKPNRGQRTFRGCVKSGSDGGSVRSWPPSNYGIEVWVTPPKTLRL